MKKFHSFLFLALILLVNSGCTKITPKLTHDDVEYRIYYDFEAADAYSIRFLNRDLTSYRKVGVEKALKLNLKIASIETLKKGFNYFVLTNNGINNLQGFPINTYPELIRYITLRKRKESFATSGGNQGQGKWRLSDHGRIHIGFNPVGDEYKNSFISVWDAKQTLEDIK